MEREGNRSSGDFFQMMQKMRRIKLSELFEDLTRTEFMALGYIQKQSGCDGSRRVKVSEIAKCTGAHFSAVSRTISGLEQRGLAVRIADSEDRRSTYVELTDPGREKLQKCQSTLDEFLHTVFERVGENDINELKRIMAEIYDVTIDELEKRKTTKEE